MTKEIVRDQPDGRREGAHVLVSHCFLRACKRAYVFLDTSGDYVWDVT